MKTKRKGFTLTAKGYWRHTAAPLRGQYEHRVIAAKRLGRKLRKDEDVHHKDAVRHNNKSSNLEVLGHDQHGFYSALQHYYVDTIINARERKEWEEYFGHEYTA